MRTNKSIWKKAFSGILTLALAGAFSLGAFADTVPNTTDTGTGTVTGNVTITGNIAPLTISVTHPATEAYAIDPNAGTFIAPNVAVTNNTKVPVNVTVQSLTSATGGSLQFTDVLPTAKNWSSLNASDSKKYIALGISIVGSSGWSTGYTTTTDWAATASPVQFGSLPSGAAGTFGFTADYGLAFDSAYTAKHNLVFLFQLT